MTLPLPEELKGYTGRIKVYRIEEDGSATILWGVSDGTRVSVVTDHFSVYLIASTSVEENDTEEDGYMIDSLQLLDSDGQALDSIPSGEFDVNVELSKAEDAEDAVVVLAAYDLYGKMLRSYYGNVSGSAAETDVKEGYTNNADGVESQKIHVENPDGNVAEIRVFVLRSPEIPVSLCPAVSVGRDSAVDR